MIVVAGCAQQGNANTPAAATIQGPNPGMPFAISRQHPLGLRDDADAPGDRYRHFQLTGAAHVVTRGGPDPITLSRLGGGGSNQVEQLSQFPNSAFSTRTVDHLVAWVMEGAAPPTAARLEMANGEIVRDEHGNARGGFAAPMSICPRSTTSPPRPRARATPARAGSLRQLYPSKADYLRRFGEGIDQCVAGNWMRQADAERLKTEEAANPALSVLT